MVRFRQFIIRNSIYFMKIFISQLEWQRLQWADLSDLFGSHHHLLRNKPRRTRKAHIKAIYVVWH